MEKQKLIIDVDKVIELYNAKNSKLRPMTRIELAKKLNVNKQILSDWKNGRTPMLVYRLLKLMEVGKCGLDQFVIKEK